MASCIFSSGAVAGLSSRLRKLRLKIPTKEIKMRKWNDVLASALEYGNALLICIHRQMRNLTIADFAGNIHWRACAAPSWMQIRSRNFPNGLNRP